MYLHCPNSLLRRFYLLMSETLFQFYKICFIDLIFNLLWPTSSSSLTGSLQKHKVKLLFRCEHLCDRKYGKLCNGVGDCPAPFPDTKWADEPGWPEDECLGGCFHPSVPDFDCTNPLLDHIVLNKKLGIIHCVKEVSFQRTCAPRQLIWNRIWKSKNRFLLLSVFLIICKNTSFTKIRNSTHFNYSTRSNTLWSHNLLLFINCMRIVHIPTLRHSQWKLELFNNLLKFNPGIIAKHHLWILGCFRRTLFELSAVVIGYDTVFNFCPN